MQDDKCPAPAGQVGNVVLLAEGGGQRDWDLLQSLCQPHHDAKTRRGRKAREDPSAMTLRIKTTYYCRQVDLKTYDGRGTKSFGSTWIVLCRYLSGGSAANGARHADNIAGMRRAARDH
jgi:hypothetical protein